jgi:hypothetical protein
MKRQSARTKPPWPAASGAPRANRYIRSGRACRSPVLQQPTRTHDRRRKRVAPGQQLVESDRLAARDAFDEPEVGARQQPHVVGVLPVDALEALGDHQPHPGRPLGDDAVLARAALAVALAGDHDLDAGGLDRVAPDRPLAAGGEAGVRIAAERGVEMHHRRERRDLVGRDVVAQRACRIERQQRAPFELRAHERRVGAEEQQARLEPECVHCYCNSMPAFFTSLAYLSRSLRK